MLCVVQVQFFLLGLNLLKHYPDIQYKSRNKDVHIRPLWNGGRQRNQWSLGDNSWSLNRLLKFAKTQTKDPCWKASCCGIPWPPLCAWNNSYSESGFASLIEFRLCLWKPFARPDPMSQEHIDTQRLASALSHSTESSIMGKCTNLKESKGRQEEGRKKKRERLQAVLVVLSSENYFGK